MKATHNECPNIIRLELSSTCNLQCPHCRHHAPEKKASKDYPELYKNEVHMSEKQVEDIINEVAEYSPSFTLNVANEPTISPTFLFAVKKIKEKGLTATFNTNGLKLSKEMCDILVDIKFDSVSISIDALTPETLIKARGIKNLDRIKKNIQVLLKARGDLPYPRIGVTFVITDYSKHELDGFIDYWKEYVDVIRVTSYITDNNPDIHNTESADVRLVSGIEAGNVNKRIPCKQLFRDIVIRANGDITPCVITSENPDGPTLGNIFDDGGVLAVWNSEKFNNVRNLHNQEKWGDVSYCKNCDYWIESNEMKEEETEDFIIRSPSPYTAFYNVKKKMGNWSRELVDRQGFDIEI